MAYLSLTDFKLGLDKRRMPSTSAAGSLQNAKNVVINRGNEIEPAKKFVLEATLPADTFGYAAESTTRYVFGSAATPAGLPAGVSYQRLQHPDASAMTRIVQAGPIQDAIFAIAEFANGERFAFYDGALITDFTDGVVRASMTNNDGIAAHMAAVINRDADYSATVSTNTFTIVGPAGRAFTVTPVTANGGAVNDQSMAQETTVLSVPVVAERAPVATLRVVAGEENIGVNALTALSINAVSIISGAVDFVANTSATASAIADEINSTVTVPDYRATVQGDTVTISAATGVGSTANGYVMSATVTGPVILSTGGFTVSGAVAGNTCSEVRLGGGANLLSATVNWSTDDATFAAAIASNIAANSGTSGYTATAEGSIIRIGKLVTTGTSPQNLTVTTAGTGSTTYTTEKVSVSRAISNMTNGVNAFGGIAQQTRITVSGTFEVGDKFTLSVSDDIRQGIVFGAGQVAGLQPTTFYGADSKVYIAAGSIVAASAIADPAKWNSDDAGTWLIDVEAQLPGMGHVVSIAEYQKNLGFFGEAGIVIYDTDPDPSLNTIVQKIARTGARAALATISYLDSDTFYLSSTGVRSLRSKDSSNIAIANDVGSPIDPLLIAAFSSLSAADVLKGFAAVDPVDGRYMLNLGSTIYSFSFFPNAKISAWTTMVPAEALTEFLVFNNQLYARGGSDGRKLYRYGGTSGTDYMAASDDVQFTLPFLDARKIATWKSWTLLDWAVEGEWKVLMCTDPNQLSQEDEVATFFGVSFAEADTIIPGEAPLVQFRFVRTDTSGYARVSNFTLHYQERR